MALPSYASAGQKIWHYSYLTICGLIFFFLIFPIMVIIPLAFNAQDFFTFTPEMLRLQADGYSLKHFNDFFNNPELSDMTIKNPDTEGTKPVHKAILASGSKYYLSLFKKDRA